MSRSAFASLVFALAVYVAFRAAVLHSNFDAVALPNYELYMGNIAHIACGGWRGAPLHQYYDNCGGHLVTGLFAIPFFASIGHSYLALKLVPVVLGMATLVLIWLVLARWFDPRAAALAALLFALGPPTLTKYSMLAKGNHFENLVLQLACVWMFMRLHSSKRKDPWVLALGVTAGFATFFYFGSMAIVVLLALTHLCIRGARRASRDSLLALPAFVVGILPLVWVQVRSGDRPGGFLSAKFGEGGHWELGAFLGRIGRFFRDYLPRAGVYEDLGPLPGRVAETIFLAVFLVAWLTLALGVVRDVRALNEHEGSSIEERERARFRALRTLPYVLYLPLVSLIVGTSTFEFKPYGPPVEVGQFRYLVPHFTFTTMMVGVAAAAHRQATSRPRRILGGALALAALSTTPFVLPLASSAASGGVSPTSGLGAAYDGYYLRYYNNVLLRDARVDETTGRLTWDHPRVERQIEEFGAVERHELWLGVGYHLAAAQTIERKTAKTPSRLDLDELCAPYPGPQHPDLARGAGSWLRFLSGLGENERRIAAEALQALALSDHSLASWVVEGLCLNFEFPLARLTGHRLERTAALEELVPASLRSAWRRGQGIECGALLARGISTDVARVRALAAALPETARTDFWLGVGVGLARDGALRELPSALEEIPVELRDAALAGLGAGMRRGIGIEACMALFHAWKEALSPSEQAALESGMRWPNYPRPLEL